MPVAAILTFDARRIEKLLQHGKTCGAGRRKSGSAQSLPYLADLLAGRDLENRVL
jgi:hypothetical protein